MKVVPKITVIDRILEKLQELRRQDLEADYIAVTRAEYQAMCADLRLDRYSDRHRYAMFDPRTPVDAMTFQTREFARKARTGHGVPYIRVASHAQFMGVPLFVVPDEYHPD